MYKREIAPNGDKRYIRRDDKGRIKNSVEEGASLSSDASSNNGSDLCKNVLAPAVRSKLNSIGSCATIIENQLKTIDDFTLTVETISLNGKTATARVQSSLNGTKVISSVSLQKASVGWRITSVGKL